MCTHTSLCYLQWRLFSMSTRQKSPPLLPLYAVELLMVFLMAADGRRERLALGLGVQCSFNKSQSVLCHYIDIFGQLLWRSGGAALHRSLWYVGIRETSGAAEHRQKKKRRWTKKEVTNTPEYLQAFQFKILKLLLKFLKLFTGSNVCWLYVQMGGDLQIHTMKKCNLSPSAKMKSKNTKTIHSHDYGFCCCKFQSCPITQ